MASDINSRVDALERTVSEIRDILEESRKTNWNLVGWLTSISIAVLTALYFLVIEPMHSDIKEIKTAQSHHVEDDSHTTKEAVNYLNQIIELNKELHQEKVSSMEQRIINLERSRYENN